MNATRTCMRMRRYPGIISGAQHTAAPPAHRIAVKAHKSRRKSENDVFKCKLSLERGGGPDPLDPPPPLVSAPGQCMGPEWFRLVSLASETRFRWLCR